MIATMASSKQHPADNHDLIRVQGVVEHKPKTIAIADHVVDLGPGAGHDGGRIVFEGTPAADLVAARST